MEKWASNNDTALMMGHLLQNCDLPTPLKVFFPASDNNKLFNPFNRDYNDDDDDTRLELLKALRLSQTRAREAERKAASLAKERDLLSKALFSDSLHLFAYRQCIRLLEAQVSVLHSTQSSSSSTDNDDQNEVGFGWFVALALCLGIAGFGVGFAFGCRYYFHSSIVM